MTYRSVIITFLAAFIVQLSLLDLFAVMGHTPNLILCVGIVLSFYFNEGNRSIPYAVGAMLLLDICSAPYAGVGALCLFSVLLFVRFCHGEFNPERYLPMITTTVFSVLIYQVLYWGVMHLLGDPMGFVFMFEKMWPTFVYDLIVASLAFLLIRKLGIEGDNSEPLEVILDEEDIRRNSFEEAARMEGVGGEEV